MQDRSSSYLKMLGSAVFWLLVWEAASLLVGNSILLAGPLDTALRFIELVPTAAFWQTILSSFGRIALGFAVGFAAALVLGLLSHHFEGFRRLMAPAFDALKSIPLVCIIVLLLLWVGSRRVSALAVFLVVLPAVYFSVLEGLDAQDGKLKEVLGRMDVSGLRLFLVDTWQQLLPYLIGTSRNVCGMAWKAGVAAEVIGSPRGTIGEQVYQAKLLLATSDLFAWTIAIVLASWACERLFLLLLRSTGPWSLHLELRTKRAGIPTSQPGPVKLEGATFGYKGISDVPDSVIASNVNCTLDAGSRWIMADPSGTGKTTVISEIAGTMPLLAGTITAPDSLSLMCQDIRLVEAYTAEENVELVSSLDRAEARKLLLELLPEDALGRPVAELSGGQRRQVELVRALAHPSALVLLDEPFASLDNETHRRAALYLMGHLDGRTLIAASHVPGDAELLDAKPLDIFVHEAKEAK